MAQAILQNIFLHTVLAIQNTAFRDFLKMLLYPRDSTYLNNDTYIVTDFKLPPSLLYLKSLSWLLIVYVS